MTETRLFFEGAVLLRFLGDGRLVGESGRGGIVSSGSNICEGSMLSPVFVLRLRVAVRGVGGAVVVCRRLARLGLRVGAGVNSSSSSSSSTCCEARVSSSSDSSTTTFRLVAALRDGRVGDIEAIWELW